MSVNLIISIIAIFFFVSLYCLVALYQWNVFKKLKTGDSFWYFIDYDHDLVLCTITKVDKDEKGNTIKIHTNNYVFTFRDYMADRIKPVNEY